MILMRDMREEILKLKGMASKFDIKDLQYWEWKLMYYKYIAIYNEYMERIEKIKPKFNFNKEV